MHDADNPELRISWDEKLAGFFLRMTWAGKHSTKPRLVDVEFVATSEVPPEELARTIESWWDRGATFDDNIHCVSRQLNDGTYAYDIWITHDRVGLGANGVDEVADKVLEENIPAPPERGMFRAGNRDIAYLGGRYWFVG